MKTAPLDAEEMRQAFRSCAIGGDIRVLETTRSTNDAIVELATADSAPGLVVFAETQTAGRGQRGNVWESAPGQGLWFSVLLRPEIPLADSGRLTAWAAGTVRETIAQAFGLAAEIKAPNDILIRQKKIAGVLVEMRAQKRAPHLAVLGIGINVNQAVADFSDTIRDRATSLAIELGHEIDRTGFAITLLKNLDETYCKALWRPLSQRFPAA